MNYKIFKNLSLKEQLEHNLPAIEAYVKGEDIEYLDAFGHWKSTHNVDRFSFETLIYRVKPKLVKDTIIIVWDKFEHKYVALPDRAINLSRYKFIKRVELEYEADEV